MLQTSEELKRSFMKFFEIIDIEKNGIVTKSDIISFFEVMKAIGQDESQIRGDLTALQNDA